MQKLILSLLTVGLININAFTQNAELKLTLRDGNILQGQAKLGNITLVTDYGKLDIPLKNISSIDVGITPDKVNSEKIINMIKQLSNSAEEMRQNAYEALGKMDINAIPVITDYIYSTKYEPSEYSDYTAHMALTELQDIYDVNDGDSFNDLIVMDYGYSMGGVYNFKNIELETEYGTLSIPKEKIKQIEVLYVPSGERDETKYVLQASKHISGNTSGGWLKTGIILKKGQKIDITASGEIVLASLSNAKYKPDGSVKNPVSENDTYEEDNYENGSTNYPTYGNVVYKIGENGTVMKAGARFSGIAKNNGMLYLSIYETVYSPGNSGSYTVIMKLK